jgi:hypothetical protein
MTPHDSNPNQLAVMGIAIFAVSGLATLVFFLISRETGEYLLIALWAPSIVGPVALLGCKARMV